MNIYARIKRLAKERKLTIQQIADTCEISRYTIGKWDSISPRIANLEKVASALGVTVDELIKPCNESQ